MKKNIFKLLIITFIFLGFTNVNAETVKLTDLPKAFKTQETGGYEYTIEGFALRVYEMNTENDNEGMANYINETPDKTIKVEAEDLHIAPQTRERTFNGVPATIIDLNLDITKEKLQNYLSAEMTTATSEKAYLVELVVKYKLTQKKVESKYMYNINLLRTLTNFYNDDKDKIKDEPLNNTITQTINVALVYYDNETSQTKLEYDTTATEENNIAEYVLNYLALCEKEFNVDEKIAINFMMLHNIDNIDEVLDDYDETEKEIKENNNPNKTEEVVKVPNTAVNTSSIIYIISILMIIMGASIITYTVSKSN